MIVNSGLADFECVTNTDLYKIGDYLSDCEVVKKKNIYYINCACSFDIETSSFYYFGEKRAVMYLWQIDINGLCLYGRTWEEFKILILYLKITFGLCNNLRLVIYVHNLGYEFQFIRKYFKWLKVFAREKRKPLQAVASDGIEFRCSLMLSGYSLAKVAENLNTYKIEKLVGDLDYSLLRSPITALTDKELGYALNDIRIIEYYIREEIERNGDITKIPLTQTGYIRRKVKNECYNKNNVNEYKRFRDRMRTMKIADIDEYRQLKRAFAGGFTHANAFYVRKTIEDVSSIDFNSSYPAVMMCEQYPMSSATFVGVITSKKEFSDYCSKYCCIFDIEFKNILASTTYDHPISISKAFINENAVVDNGRIVSADLLGITITEVDFSYIKNFYIWDDMRIYNFRYYLKDYLPKPIIKVMGELYRDKTSLKGVAGKEVEYLHSKGLLNAIYGMMVTDICPNEIEYKNDEWLEIPYDENDIDRYNNAKQRFLYYPWGIYVTAYARRNLFTGILEFKDDYIYSDTDSIKCTNYDKHLDYIQAYNENVISKSIKCLTYHNLPLEYAMPTDVKGEKRYIGVWDYEGTYKRFKTLGAKRYLVDDNGKYSLTVSGVNKKVAIPYLLKEYCDIFEAFTENLVIPVGKCGKKILSYIDESFTCIIVDYLGNEYECTEQSAIHMEETSYSFSMSAIYLNYLAGIVEDRF